jgi:FG-GAP repeat protein
MGDRAMRRTARRRLVRASRIALLVAGGSVIAVAAASAQEQLYKWFGDQANEHFGTVAVGGDVTGDGIPDFLIGANGASINSGAVIARSGADGSLGWKLAGNSGEYLGSALAFMGDVDGDGFTDFASTNANPPGGAVGGWGVTIYSGATRAPLRTILGGTGEKLGIAIEPMGDLDGDGVVDLALAEGLYAEVHVFSGKSGALLYTIPSPNFGYLFGYSIASGRDVDGDGFWDLMIGDPYASPGGVGGGAAFLYSGKSGAFLFELDGSVNNDFFGYSVALIADVDLDGVADVLIGAPNESQYGLAHVFSGANGSQVWTVGPPNYTSSWIGFGGVVADAGDMNRDGFGDFIVVQLSGVGIISRPVAHLHSGRDGSRIYHYLDPYSVMNSFASSVELAPDVDGDGVQDLAFASPLDDDGSGKIAGSVSVWRGNDLFVDPDPTIVSRLSMPVLTVDQGVANAPYALFLAEVLTTPTSILLAVGVLDAAGRATLSGGYVPDGLQGFTFGFKAYSLDANSKVIDSGIGTLYVE